MLVKILLNATYWYLFLALQSTEGIWLYDQQDINVVLTLKYFTNLYHTNHYLSTLNKSYRINQDLIHLGDIPTELEIRGAVDSFKPYKAPGPDGIHPFFYQNYWDLVGESIISLCVNAFKNDHIPSEINKTHLCLIPKKKRSKQSQGL